jgi:hypothetical protein
MSLVIKLIYGGTAIFGTVLTANRLLSGDWLAALWPLAITAFCVVRLYMLMDNESA